VGGGELEARAPVLQFASGEPAEDPTGGALVILDVLAPLAVAVDSLTPLPGNPRRGDVEAIAASLARFGQRKPIVVDAAGSIIAGNHTWQAARQLGWTHIAAVRVSDDDATARAFALADNRTAELGSYDEELLATLINEVGDVDPALLDASGWSDKAIVELMATVGAAAPWRRDPTQAGALAKRYVQPPFSVLRAESGRWKERKRQWLAQGIASHLGRDALGNDSVERLSVMQDRIGRHIPVADVPVSTFDPVLAEICYAWFSPSGGSVLDPFAGGSVRGVVATLTGRTYTGIDLSEKQVLANRSQWDLIGPVYEGVADPEWIIGDSAAVLQRPEVPSGFDFVFSCPPYADLEVYSADPHDLSNMTYDDFLTAYRQIIKRSCDRLADNRFACFVVGEVRNRKSGVYRNLVSDTIAAFQDAGLEYWNEIILHTADPTRALRTSMFASTRKIVKAHQNVLVFIKGDVKLACDALGDVDVLDLSEGDDEAV
jgi:hypothetical protein